ncbi:MAG: thiamine biosynthesis protein ThiF [Streptosporangiales bacterium]|nr:thiamine biosynthesis protein ThiF [Streptosporangiales bacterium]
MRPVLKPALRCLWRDASTLQLGVDPRRAVMLTGLGGDTVKVLDILDGTRDSTAVIAAARARGVPEATARHLLDLLSRAGVLDDATTGARPPKSLDSEELERLRPDLASICLDCADTKAGMQILARRRSAYVRVYGAGRVGASLASLLAAAGVGRVQVNDPGWVRGADLAPAGYTEADVGERREEAAPGVLRRTAPRTATSPGDRVPDLAVLAPPGPADPALTGNLVRDGIAHLFVGVRETVGVVGPLVLPGRSSCLRCQELHRRDRDPAWPRILAQLCSPHRAVEACDIVLATAVAAHGALQALTYLEDRSGTPPTVDGTLEMALPDWRWRRRSWPRHPGCGCGWDNTV